MHSYSVNDQFIIHGGVYTCWITLMAYMRKFTQHGFTEYITYSLLDTITLDKMYIRGHIYMVPWFFIVIILYINQIVRLYWTITYKKTHVPEVIKFQGLAPKIK